MRAHLSPLKRHAGAGACLLVLLCAVLGVSAPAIASPAKITFSTGITKSTLPGVGANDTLTIDFIVDNGSSGLLGQSWDLDDILSATVRAGSLTRTYTDGWWQENPDRYAPAGWRTDSEGKLVFNQFYGVWDGYQFCVREQIADCKPAYDTVLNADSIHDLENPDRIAYFENGWSAYEGLFPQGSWSISEVPVPGTLPLLGAGLLGLGLLRRRG